MRDFLFHSEELLDKNALLFLEKESIPGILPCRWVRWNSMIQLVYFTDNLTPLSQQIDEMTIDELRGVGKDIIDYIKAIEEQMDLSPENIVWDTDSIYLDEDGQVYLICLPAVIPVESLESKIYVKRLYSVLNDIFMRSADGDFVCRQIEAQRKKDTENWDELKDAIDREEPSDAEALTLRSINAPDPVEFIVEHADFIIGSDETVDGYLDLPGISAEHALIGWNEISFYVRDLCSESGTYLNDVQIQPEIDVPLGSGSILKFGDYTFNVE